MRARRAAVLLICCAGVWGGAAACGGAAPRVLTMSGSMLGLEGDVLRRQLDRFRAAHPDVAVQLRPTPDAADLRHQLYVQWLNARVSEPDVLQLDVVWTPEFAAAGWIAPLDAHQPQVAAFFAPTVAAHRWNGGLYALPWFVDVGMLYWRTDLLPHPPRTLEELVQMAAERPRSAPPSATPAGFVWQGARYEGLVTVFLEHLGAFGGAILDDDGAVTVDDPRAVRALTFMRDAIHQDGVVPAAVLTWQEEQTRFAFQNGQAMFMRNWPYAYALLQRDAGSKVADRFGVAPIPAAAGGQPTAALGGSALAVNAYSDQPADAYALIQFLLEPARMLERAEVVGQFPPRLSLYEGDALTKALGIPAADVRRIVEAARPRPVTPVYSQLSSILQVALHEALTEQADPSAALQGAAREMRALLARAGLTHSS